MLNCGVGAATQQASLLDGAVADLTLITGQKPLVTRAKKSIAGFKLREGNAIGAKVTLRGDRMWEFYDRLVSIAIPRIRDFRGLNPNSFDGRGNYTFGVTEQLIFPEIDYDKIDTVRGMDITIVTTGTTDDRAAHCSARLGFPFRREASRGNERWPRRRSSRSSSARRSSRCAGTRGAAGAAVHARCTAFGLCRICFRDHGPRRRGPRRDQGVVVRGRRADDDRPDRRHAHPDPQREHRDPRRGADAVVEAQGGARKILEQEGYIEGWDVPRTDQARATS